MILWINLYQLEKKIISIFISTFKYPYFEYLIGNSFYFINVVIVTKRIEQSLKFRMVKNSSVKLGFMLKMYHKITLKLSILTIKTPMFSFIIMFGHRVCGIDNSQISLPKINIHFPCNIIYQHLLNTEYITSLDKSY